MNQKSILVLFSSVFFISCGGGGPIEDEAPFTQAEEELIIVCNSSDENETLVESKVTDNITIYGDYEIKETIDTTPVPKVEENDNEPEVVVIEENTKEEEPIIINNESTQNSDTNENLDSFNDTIYRSFNVGFGGSGSFSFLDNNNEPVWLNSTDLILDDNIENNAEYKEIKYFNAEEFDILQQKLKNSKFIVYWITKYWQESWHNIENIQRAMDKGYIPVFNYWYFADKLSGGLPNDSELEEYSEHNTKLSNFLSQLKGTKFLIMEPEFNKKVVIEDPKNQTKFISIISDAIDNIKSKVDNLKFSLCMMDTGSRSINSDSYEIEKCGYENCSLGDKYEWDKLENIYNGILSKLDFISFEQMIAQFNRDKVYTNDDSGIDFLASRVSNLSRYLRDKYKKPIFMPYIAVATASWNDENGDSKVDDSELDLSGWEDEANHVYTQLIEKKSELLNNGLFGFAVMSLFDEPRHDINGYQYFMNNEYHLGIIKSSAVDEIDKYSFGDIVSKQDIVDVIFKDK